MDIIGNHTLRALLREKSTLHPNKIFLLFEDRNEDLTSLTYGEFYDKVNRLCGVFYDLGLQKGDRVTLHLSNCVEFMLSWFALVSIGAVMVPTNVLSTADEMEYILQNSESKLLLTEPDYLSKVALNNRKLPYLRRILLVRGGATGHPDSNLNLLLERAVPCVPDVPLEAEDEAAMLYTSGTTSRPKGVLVTHANYVYAGEVMSKSIRLGPDDRTLIVLPLFHANAQYYSTMAALTVGASIALVARFSASKYFKQAKRLQATVGSLFAAPLRMILGQTYDPDDAVNSLRVIWFAQTVTQTQLDDFEHKYTTKLLHMYGMTETIATPLMNPIDGQRKNMGIGKPVLGVEVRIVDEEGHEVSPGVAGQLIVKGVRGRTLMKGYFNSPSATDDALRGEWLYTGDNAMMDEDGYFYFVDRVKDMIKRSGENVAAGEVERVLAEHPAIFDCAVIGIPDDIRDESIKAYAILREGKYATEEEIILFCRDRLSKFKVPEFVEFVTELPRTSVGKIQKHILRAWHLGNSKSVP